MIAPIPPPLLYGLWDPEGGDDGAGGWMTILDGDLPNDCPSYLAFADRSLALDAARRLMDKHQHMTGRRPLYIVESMIGANAMARAAFAGGN